MSSLEQTETVQLDNGVKLHNITTNKTKVPIKKKIVPYLYLLPAVLLVGVFFIYSAVYTLVISFTKWDGINLPDFVGFSNYISIFTDKIFTTSIINTIIWVLASLLLPVGVGLAIAVGIQHLRWSIVYKNIFYLPHAISLTTTGVVWAFLLSPGGLSSLFDLFGWKDLAAIDWLLTPTVNTLSMIWTYTWQSMGTNMVLFLIGLNAIPKEPLEAAMIDGASGWRLFKNITFPLLRPITSVVVLMSLVNSFKVFDTIWVMTQGGPFRSSETLAVTMYRETFVLSHYGYGSAIAVILSIFVLILSWGYLKTTLKQEG
ncbi:sugar ABC transporter permease [Bacillus sp. sid0103]|uniref:carbohydrate ABC transporter permease n=1 Tax=Bacillus sp. sid0103 TaxID=2856337 RepID=UPI001C460527|nr:sugar ABC transporter permease [Bacillus sp. sid0103]MBV7504375.1 sugar ABC transporter permease [Bacillus sp. sid0103]